MAGEATISFSQGGVQPPVYVVTSLSGWTTLEMHVDNERTNTGDLVFTKHFSNVAEGRYQYKIRIGESHWVVDESKESDMDEHGNRNNVIHVEPASDHAPLTEAPHDTITEGSTSNTSNDKTLNEPDDQRKDSDADEVPAVPVPFVTVEKVVDKEQPSYGDLEPISLPADASKRAADAEPDFEEVKTDPPAKSGEPSESPEVPLLIVERTDGQPAYGDDFGENATTAQKIAHEMRAADASPDKLVVSPELNAGAGTADEQAAPLFRHESIQADQPLPTSLLEKSEEGFVQSSTDHISTGDAINTLSESNDLGKGDGFDQAPLLSHETDLLNGNGTVSDDYDDEDEFDKAPLLSHETDFSDSRGSQIRTDSDYLEDDENMEPRHYRPYDDEDDYLANDSNDAPLLPHERDSAVISNAGSDDGQFSLREQPTFGYESDDAKESPGGSGRANIFRARTNSSNLPHKLPRSDEEDENLNDPSLERFPTNREQILERVATIGLNLPEDESMEDHHHSPPMSVLSQACSSVDLAPVKSYTSLASVPEADISDEEDEDVDSLPSPVYMGGSSARTTHGPSGFARDPYSTPMPDESKQLGLIAEDKAEAEEDKPEVRSSHATDSSEAESVNKHDGAKDSSSILSSLGEAIATPAKMLSPFTPPLTPERESTAKEAHPVSHLDVELRERRKRVEDSGSRSEVALADTAVDDKDKTNSAKAPAPTQQPGHFLTACVGDRKRASASVMVLGVAAGAAYYFLTLSP